MGGEISGAMRLLVAERAAHRCEYCLLHQDDSFTPHQIDHIVSRKHGGDSSRGNLALACIRCNAWNGSDIASFGREPAGWFLYFIRGAIYGTITFGLWTVRSIPLRKRLLRRYVCSGLTCTTA
jgi:hypothetical protein